MAKKYIAGSLKLVITMDSKEKDELLYNLFDSMILMDSTTQTMVHLEIADYDLEELVLLGADEDEDIKLV